MDISQSVESALRLNTVKYINVASGVIFICDYFQTFEMEVEHVWQSRTSLGNILFFVSRYLPFFDMPLNLYYALAPSVSPKTCLWVYSTACPSTILATAVADAMMALRVYALWGNSRTVMIILLCLLVTVYGPGIIILAFYLRSVKYGNPPLPTILGCYAVEENSLVLVDWALLMFLEATLLGLSLWIGFKRFRHSHNRLVWVLYRDGTLYLVCLFLFSAANIIVLVAGPLEYVDLLNTFQRVMHCVLSTRLVLHVRDSGHRGRILELREQGNAPAFTLVTLSTVVH
ncbi:hypothetical protein Hypma_012418 [Hypsizygus marmoreus]|uniref:DUF6533 domain-containing protein n=1 Tax=Hypsizygus marmoreus TaxID=39966 RepID=A0A369JJ97_HYPMA|nr:hypothetical protein Hypma_012418 [Hypsizygus marmoreus]